MASVLNLLGHTVRAQQRHKLAISYFKQALELNPFLWEAYECLCELGDLQDPNTLFTSFNQRTTSSQQRPPLQRSRTSVLDGPLSTVSQSVTTQGENVESASADPFSVTSSAHLRYDTRQKTDYFSSMLGNNTALSFQQNDPRLMGYEGVERIAVPLSSTSAWNHGSSLNTTIDATERVTLKRGKKKPERSKSAFNLRPTGSGTGISKRGPERSASIANFAASGMNARMQLRQASILGTKKDTAINEDRDLFRDTATSPLPVMSSEADPSAGKGELEILMDVFRVSARSYALLSLNRYSDAMTELEALPHEHLQSGWAQCQLGKCKFGLVDYTSAIRYFGHARELEPGLQQDMELYSTCLWHMRKETMLSTLAKELKDANLHSPQAWVALGNAFSLRRETEQALKCFHRAIQLNDRFAYAHTLSGHEYSDLEEYDKAQTAFRRAMSIDPRHYQAWFGLGVIYDKMGKYDLALIHYKEAHNLNRSSGVLLYRVGQCQEKLSRVTEALRSFEDVIRIDSSNVAARYSKARIQTDMGQYEQALQELEVIKKLAPDEPNAFLLQGKVLQKMGDKAQALKYLTYALNLDSKSSHTIRDIIEKLELDADYEEESYEVKIDADL
ncbi:anaphase-promoting complex subunit cdc27 [Mortierella claussenii]|nr:anaphase-promoting complex subunit cdc27 [Mortierella claussenii]